MSTRKRRVLSCLELLESAGLVERRESGAESDNVEWLARAGAAAVVDNEPKSAKRGAHRAIADEMLRDKEPSGPALVGALPHLIASNRRRQLVSRALRATEYLRSTHQNEKAQHLLGEVLSLVSLNRPNDRLRIVLELSEIRLLAGDFDSALEALRDVSQEYRRCLPSVQSRYLLFLAVVRARRGDYQQAKELFKVELNSARENLSTAEFLCFLTEYAATNVILDDHELALGLCATGLDLAKRSRSPAVQEAALSLYAARANVALRTGDHALAIEEYEKSFALATRLGSLESQALLLNNLGNAYGQCERYSESLRALRDAEVLCSKIQSGPSPVTVKGNLALIESRVGDFDSARSRLAELALFPKDSLGARQRLFLLHVGGLCDLYQGLYRKARLQLDEAAQLATDLGDRYLAPIDRVFAAEALIFEASYTEASARLEELLAENASELIRGMTLSRRALLAARVGDPQLHVDSMDRLNDLSWEGNFTFLLAWNDLLVAWSDVLCGDWERALPRLHRALRCFDRSGCEPFAGFARCVEIEGLLLFGDFESANKSLLRVSMSASGLVASWKPLLESFLRFSEGVKSRDCAIRCADLLAEADASLAANPLPEWSDRV
ncbi:MAG: tetratricopeptide repeat protein, partial [Planctomycetota bacterium]